jgi:hypothetical protein
MIELNFSSLINFLSRLVKKIVILINNYFIISLFQRFLLSINQSLILIGTNLNVYKRKLCVNYIIM